jgi:hypothetical protein
MTTIAEAISRIRTSIKAVKEDSFLTDRTIYFSISKYAKTLIKREDNQFKLMKMSQIFKVLPYVELINVDKVEAGCIGVYSECFFKRSKDKLPNILDGMFGPIIRTVSSIDGSIEMFRTEPGTWSSITKSTTFKYNKRFYFWIIDGYIYCPNVDWEAIKIEAIFENDIENCKTNDCLLIQDQAFNIPEYLFSEVEQLVIKDLTMTLSIPADSVDDSQNTIR